MIEFIIFTIALFAIPIICTALLMWVFNKRWFRVTTVSVGGIFGGVCGYFSPPEIGYIGITNTKFMLTLNQVHVFNGIGVGLTLATAFSFILAWRKKYT